VTDRLMGSAGSGEVRLFGIRLASDAGTPEMHAGALHRYLAEAVWFPGALWPSERLTWQPIDDARALAILTDASTSVSLEFRFDAAGDVASIFTPGRWGKHGRGSGSCPGRAISTGTSRRTVSGCRAKVKSGGMRAPRSRSSGGHGW
jgi:hypothetical protein